MLHLPVEGQCQTIHEFIDQAVGVLIHGIGELGIQRGGLGALLPCFVHNNIPLVVTLRLGRVEELLFMRDGGYVHYA